MENDIYPQFSPHGSTLWNNRVIIINRKSLFRSDWHERGILFVSDLLDCNGKLLDVLAFSTKYNITCTAKDYNKICKAIPVPLIEMIHNTLLYSNVVSVLPSLECIGDTLKNNKSINASLKSHIFHNLNRGLFPQGTDLDTLSVMEKALSYFIKWPISPKAKETHFKIVHKIYPVSTFLNSRFKFEVEPCSFCNLSDESLEHLFFSCPFSKLFWSNVRDWLLLKLTNIPAFKIYHILYYIDNLDSPISDLVNIIIILGKYHLHCSKWRGGKPSFPRFINEFKSFFLSPRKIQSGNMSIKICNDISKWLLF